jgi:O-antigen ligase
VRNIKRLLTTEKFLSGTTILLAFFLPSYKKIVPMFIMLFIVSWIIYLVANRRQIKFSVKLPWILSAALYAIYAISMVYTTNVGSGLFDLEVKLSLLVFPLILTFTSDALFTKDKFNNILYAFVAGTFATTLVCISVAFYRCFTIFFTLDFFRYTYLANFLHPTYLSMFVNLSIAIVISKLIEHWLSIGLIKKISAILLALFFITLIFLLDSKAGIIVLPICIVAVISISAFKKVKTKPLIVSLISIVVCCFLIIRFVPYLNERFSQMDSSIKNFNGIKVDTDNDSEQRILIWRYSAKIISETWPIGVGAGDVNLKLHEKYGANGFTHGIQKNLNCHNQFLQTFVAIGIFGFFVMLILLGSLLVIAVKRKNVVLLSFLIIIVVNMLAESILEVQAGTVFFGFFAAFLTNMPSEGKEIAVK